MVSSSAAGEPLDVGRQHGSDAPTLASEVIRRFFQAGQVEAAVEDLVAE